MVWVHLLVLYGVGYHMPWTTVVHTIYNLLSTAYIWCGYMPWVHMSSADAIHQVSPRRKPNRPTRNREETPRGYTLASSYTEALTSTQLNITCNTRVICGGTPSSGTGSGHFGGWGFGIGHVFKVGDLVLARYQIQDMNMSACTVQ